MRRMRRIVALAAFVALMVPSLAHALTFTATTTKGKRPCTVQVITEPTRFGLEVQKCAARRVGSVAFLMRDERQVIATTAPSTGPLPYSNVGTSDTAGFQVRVDFALFLKPQRFRRHPVKWRRKAGGAACHGSAGGERSRAVERG